MRRDITRRGLIAGAVLLGTAEASRGWEAVLPVTGLDQVNIRAPQGTPAAEFYAKLFGTQVSRARIVVRKTGAEFPGNISGGAG